MAGRFATLIDENTGKAIEGAIEVVDAHTVRLNLPGLGHHPDRRHVGLSGRHRASRSLRSRRHHGQSRRHRPLPAGKPRGRRQGRARPQRGSHLVGRRQRRPGSTASNISTTAPIPRPGSPPPRPTRSTCSMKSMANSSTSWARSTAGSEPDRDRRDHRDPPQPAGRSRRHAALCGQARASGPVHGRRQRICSNSAMVAAATSRRTTMSARCTPNMPNFRR